MAPRKPIRAKAAAAAARKTSTPSTSTNSSSTRQPFRTQNAPSHPWLNQSDTLSSTKADKRHIKRSLLASKLAHSTHVSSRISKPKKRSRRPKELSGGNLSALADALDDADVDVDGMGGRVGNEMRRKAQAQGISEVKRALVGGESLRSRGGVQRRREEVAKAERKRFVGNLGVLGGAAAADSDGGSGSAGGEAEGGGGTGTGTEASAGTWAALRAHIAQSMAAQQGRT